MATENGKNYRRQINWVGSTIMLSGILLLVLAYFLQVWHTNPFIVYLAQLIGGAAFVLGFASLILELPLFTRYMEQRLRNVFFEEESIKLLNRDALKRIRLVATKALSLGAFDASEDSLYNTIENQIYPVLDQPYRPEFDLYIKYAVRTMNGQRILAAQTNINYKIVNETGASVEIPIALGATLYKIEGLDHSQLYKLESCTINGEPIENECAEVPYDEKDEKIVFRMEETHLLGKDEEAVIKITEKKVLPLNDYSTYRMRLATQRINVSVEYPADIEKPDIFAFGLGDIKEQHSSGTNVVWRFDGWMLPNHGLVIVWKTKETNNQASVS